MERMDYFLDVYGTLPRAGPGDNASTRKAFGMMTDLPDRPRILDLGCGPGMQTVELLRCCDGTVVALDVFPQMIKRVESAAVEAGVADRMEPMQADMTSVRFEPGSFDVVWSEGAIYFLGFENGLARVKDWVKPGGYVAVSESVWLTDDPPQEAIDFWKDYPEIDTVDAKLEVIAKLGYTSVGHFILPRSSWTDLYYKPMEQRVAECAAQWQGIEVAEGVLVEARREIALYHACGDCFSYGFFVMRT